MTDTPAPALSHHAQKPRARDLGLEFDGVTGKHNAITDVPGVEVGYHTLISGSGPLVVGEGPVRTGVTAILPRGKGGVGVPCAAGTYSFNGNGELTGRAWIDESGTLNMPIAITNSHSVGACHQGVDEWVHRNHPRVSSAWMLPVVGETWDGFLNDINGQHVKPEHAGSALDSAAGGAVAEGNVGGGTGMNCYGFKGGSGTASRVVVHDGDEYVVGAFLQGNFGRRSELTLSGHKLGRQSSAPNQLAEAEWWERDGRRARAVDGAGSVIVVVATNAPLLPGQCAALARRAPLGLARTGTTGSHFSGDIMVAFSTANEGSLTSTMGDAGAPSPAYESIRFIPWGEIDPFYSAVVEAVEEAVANALVAAEDLHGRDDHFSAALPHDEVRAAVKG